MKSTTISLHKCRGCNLPAQSIEKIRTYKNGRISFRATHENGIEHRWEEYGSIWKYWLPSKPETQHIRQTYEKIVCPRCNNIGNVKQDHVRHRYFVDHRSIYIGGVWPKNGNSSARRYKQCCMRKGTEVQLFLSRISG